MNYALINAQRQLEQLRQQHGVQYRPNIELPPLTPAALPPAARAPVEPPSINELNHHGDIAIAAMRAGEACHYQLWLTLRLLDVAGSGRMEIGTAREMLTKEHSDLFLYKWARLRQLLAEGNGRFWLADDAYIWLRGTVPLAAALGVKWLNGRFCTISADIITGRTMAFRAHCYAAWLGNHDNPISQATIERLTGISPRTQRRYCRLANIRVRNNITVGPPASAAAAQECAWQHNTFDFIDFQGKQGPALHRYIAWHLPASYDTTITTPGSRRQQKRHNRELAQSLANTEAPGNQQSFSGIRLFFAHGKAAARRRMSGNVPAESYWFQCRARSGTGIWNVMSDYTGF